MKRLPRRAITVALAAGVLVRVALASALPLPGAIEPLRPSTFHEFARETGLSMAAGVAVRAPGKAGVTVWRGVRAVAGGMGSDVASFWRFLGDRLTFSPSLSDNPFFVAHKEAALVCDKADAPWDLDWAVPQELRAPGAWRAAVASLPAASVRGARSSPETGVSFVGWPPVAD